MFDKYYVSKISKPFTCACFVIDLGESIVFVCSLLSILFIPFKVFCLFDFEVHNENFGDEIMYLVIFVFLS